jgi:F-type H+-transporting ATPase subunit b
MIQTRRQPSRARRISWRALLGLSLLLLSLLVPAALHHTVVRAADGQASSSEHAAHQANGPGAQLARETREAEGEDENAGFKHSSAVGMVAKLTGLTVHEAYWLCVLVNFGIVAGFIVWVSKKHLPVAFRNRTASIQKAMQEARRASEEANRRLTEIESRLSRLDAEITAMRATAEQEAAQEEARIKAAAEEDARRIVESAEREIDAASKAARRELTAHAADLAVALAQQQAHVDLATDQALVRNFAQDLSADGASQKEQL